MEKKGGRLHPCIEYPLPLVPSALEQLFSARIFTKLDLHSMHNLVYIRARDERKTSNTLSTFFGRYQYKVVLYGLSCTPLVFQYFINT